MTKIKAIAGIVLVLAVASIAPAMAQQNNVISIGDVSAAPGESITTHILINTATGIAGIKINLSYNPAIVNVTDYTLGDFNDMDNTDISTAQDGYVIIWVIVWSGLSGDKTVANVELTAVGSASYDTSDLNISIISLKNDTGLAVTGSTKNGSFTLISALTLTPIPSPTITEPPAPAEGVGGDERATPPRDTTDDVVSTPMPTPTPPGFVALYWLNRSSQCIGDFDETWVRRNVIKPLPRILKAVLAT